MPMPAFGTSRTSGNVRLMSAYGGRADIGPHARAPPTDVAPLITPGNVRGQNPTASAPCARGSAAPTKPSGAIMIELAEPNGPCETILSPSAASAVMPSYEKPDSAYIRTVCHSEF